MFLCDEYARTITAARALAAEALTRRRMRSAECKVRNALTPAQIALMCQPASPWRPLPSVGLPALVKRCGDFPVTAASPGGIWRQLTAIIR
jgi:hypothetical protein